MVFEAYVTLTWFALVHSDRVDLSELFIKFLELNFGKVSRKVPNE